jgi:murein L,D-transpeptidase YafK
MNPMRFAPLALCLGVGTASAHVLLPLSEVDRIVVDKSERWMQLWSGGELVRKITGIQLGDAPIGHKQFEGDERTPEGRYEIDWGNPESSYHLSLHISYPNAADEAFAAAQGKSAGGMIMVHGQPNWLPTGRIPGDWTDGCIALSNEEMELLWQSVPDGTVIEILP